MAWKGMDNAKIEDILSRDRAWKLNEYWIEPWQKLAEPWQKHNTNSEACEIHRSFRVDRVECLGIHWSVVEKPNFHVFIEVEVLLGCLQAGPCFKCRPDQFVFLELLDIASDGGYQHVGALFWALE